MKSQTGGGSVGQSLKYVDPTLPERSAEAGSNLLVEDPQHLIVRPAIGGGCGCGTRKSRKGGFYPSIMSGVVSGGVVTAPLAAFTARKLLTRKGGAKKSNIWKKKKEEARAILETYGKPSAANIQMFAAAMKKGEARTKEFLNAYKEEKMEQQMAENAKYKEKQAKLLEKSRAKAAKEAAKATKKAAREAKKAAKAATQTKKRRKVNKEAYGTVTKAEWQTLVKQAREKLKKEGKPTKNDIELLASLMMNNKNTSQFMTNFAARPTQTKKSRTKKATASATTASATAATPVKRRTVKSLQATSSGVGAAASATPSRRSRKTKEVTTATASATAAKPKKEPSNASKKYFEELSKARTYLGTIGAPTGPNMSKFASMKLKGENTTSWEENFKTRRPLSMAKPQKKKKTAAAAAAAVAAPALSAVKEENENNMQGYSENFESE